MKFYPSNLPRPLQSGYTARHKPNMIRTAMADGYARQRLINQGAPDELQITILLSATQYREFLQWYKADIRSGASWYVMPLLSVDEDSEIQYRYVRIQNGTINAKLMTTSRALGSLYQISCTLDASNTVVDDGSWEDHYLPTGDDGSSQGEFIAIPPDAILSDADDLGDTSGTYTVIES